MIWCISPLERDVSSFKGNNIYFHKDHLHCRIQCTIVCFKDKCKWISFRIWNLAAFFLILQLFFLFLIQSGVTTKCCFVFYVLESMNICIDSTAYFTLVKVLYFHCVCHFLLPAVLHNDQWSVFCWASRNTIGCWYRSKSKGI